MLGGNLNNPNSQEFRRGLLGNDVPWSYRLSGVYDLPYRIASLSGTMQYYTGVPESTTVSVASAAVPGGLTQVTQSILVRAARHGAAPERVLARYQSAEADSAGFDVIRAEAGLLQRDERIHGHQLAAELGSTYHRASTIQAGRMIKVGFNFEF